MSQSLINTKSEQNRKIELALPAIDEIDYGSNYKDHLLEQYKIYLTLADKISDRRATTNNFFLTLNTGFISAIGIVGYVNKDRIAISKDYILFLTIALIAFCYFWYRLIRSYKDLNSAKFRVIHEIEKRLPLKPFDAEWEALARGKDKNVYMPFSKIEIFIPLIFALFHLLLLAYIFIAK